MGITFRADHIGSLRPTALLEARYSLASSSQIYTLEIPTSVKTAEQNAIQEVVQEQLTRNIRPITDDEYARHIFYEGFFEKIPGFTIQPNLPIPSAFRSDFPTTTGLAKMGATTRAAVICTSPILPPNPQTPSAYLQEWLNLRSTLPRTAYTPSSGYTTDESYFHALAAHYRHELRTLYDAGLRNIQIDDPHLTYFCSSQFLSGCAKDNVDPSALLDLYLQAHNWCLEEKPADLHVGVHLCRGNMSGSVHWTSGSYEHVAAKPFQATNFQTYYLEFDNEERTGGFSPLRHLPRGSGKRVVLELVSTKDPKLEDREDVKQKIGRAVDVLVEAWDCERGDALEVLALSPQYGFSSSSLAGGKGMTRERMWEKLELVRDVAGEVWSGP